MAELRTPDEWCKLTGTHILDADGWRGENGKDWHEPITEEEFHYRSAFCTIRLPEPDCA